MNKKRFVEILLIVLTAFFIFQLDVADAFSHGYFTDSIEYSKIYEGDLRGYADLEGTDYTLSFSPIKDHFAGFVLYFADQPAGNKGTVELRVDDRNGNTVDTISVDLSKVQDRDDYKVYANKSLKKGGKYTLTISAHDCETYPKLILIDPDYITEECTDSDLLLGYAYQESTFTVTEKTLITLFMVSALLLIISLMSKRKNKFLTMYRVGIFCLLMTVMAWNYSCNTFGYKNDNFTDFDKYSENLVTTTIKADREGMKDIIPTGLNSYSDVTGPWFAADKSFLTDDNWTKGYNNKEPKLLFRSWGFVNNKAVVGYSIQFENGDRFKITGSSCDEYWTTIELDAGRPLNWWKYGDLENIRFVDTDGKVLEKGYSNNYTSQYGLQGKIYKHLGRYVSIEFLNVLTAIAAAFVLMIVVFLIRKRYNLIFAGAFFATFLLGQWIVNFARNLYWVEFTWFLPMATGLFCSWKINSKKCRMISYFAAYVFVAVKSLCGYEYITVVMLGMITFLLADLITALIDKDKEIAKLVYRTTFFLGIAALAGFFTAICVQAHFKPGADGNILKGIKIIFQGDVLRRTSGTDINLFDTLEGTEGYAQLSSVWETVTKYFHFNTEIITGIDGSLFPLFCIIPILLYAYDITKKKADIRLMALYAVSFLISMSWFVLAKSHSYVHTHLNYVVWYFGFIQVCLYTMIDRIVAIYRGLRKEKQEFGIINFQHRMGS